MARENLIASQAKSIPSLNALRAFEVAGRHMNFRKAAEELHVTSGAISQQVRKLEGELGMDLFVRSPEGLALTPIGRVYHRQLMEFFEGLREATAALRPATGAVTISVTPTVASKWLIPRLPEFAEIHPQIDVRIIATERVLSFHAEPIDLVIRQSTSSFGSGVTAKVLFPQELVAVCAKSLLDGRAPPLSEDEIAHLPLLHDSGDFWPEFLGGGTDGTVDAVSGVRLGATGLCLDAALAGQGVALASRFLVERELSDGRLVLVTTMTMQGPETFYLLRRRDVTVNAATEAFQNWLQQQALR